ncbi:MAG: hypothetical protein Q9184_005073, partial [Pyrenodesmia sp. 2 TL-2023]
MANTKLDGLNVTYERSFLEKDIDPEEYSQWPFSSPYYEAETTHGPRIYRFIEYSVPYGDLETVDLFNDTEGKGIFDRDVPLKNVLHGLRDGSAGLRVIFLAFERDGMPLKQKKHFYIPLRKDLFLELLDAIAVPPSFVDVLADNNGSHNAYLTTPCNAYLPEAFHLFIKLPNTATTWCTLYFRYEMETAVSTLLVIGSHTQRYRKRIEEVYRSAANVKGHQEPFGIIAAVIAEMSNLFEEERRIRDREVQDEEVKTGFAPMRTFTSNRNNFTMGSTRSLHLVAGHLRFLQRAVEFQICLSEFLLSQHETITLTRKSRLTKAA